MPDSKKDIKSLFAELTNTEPSPMVAKKGLKRMYIPERAFEIHEGDPDWEPSLSGKALYRRNSGEISPETTAFVEGTEVQVDLNSNGDGPFTVYLYIPFGITYEHNPNLCTSSFGRRFNQAIEVFPLEECITIKEPKTLPACASMIPSKGNIDADLELYDYPFTMLPLQNSCSSEKLGHSAKAVGPCAYAREGNFESCSAYQPFEPIEIGHISSTPIVLSRQFIDYELVNNYQYGEQSFETYQQLKDYVSENSLTFELTWSPLAPPVPFFETIIGRLNTTYPQDVQIHDQKV